MKSNEDNKTWISNILVRNIFLCLKQVYCCLTFVCVYMLQVLSYFIYPFQVYLIAWIIFDKKYQRLYKLKILYQYNHDNV